MIGCTAASPLHKVAQINCIARDFVYFYTTDGVVADAGAGGDDAVAAGRLDGAAWQGAHVIFRKAGHPLVVVSNHSGDIPTGTLRSICAAAGWEWPVKA